MGSSDSGVGSGLVDSGAGSIVWVRRRNGSWWPGKIMGPDELSASHLMSPRSGTPVKLLGREDASVDWYNLEKSKRVKAFRCGEFDDCIERAEASLGLPAKKREKYARREDAILHALELEKQFLEKKYGKLGATNSMGENTSDSERKGLAILTRALGNGNGDFVNHELYQLDQKVNLSARTERNNNPPHAQEAKYGTQMDLEEHNHETSCQIRGLQEFGVSMEPLNGMVYTSAASDDSNRMAIDGHLLAVSGSGPCFENSTDSDSRNSIDKRKRPLEGFIEESIPKRHAKHHSFVKVLQSSEELPGHSLQPDGEYVSMYGKEEARDLVRRSMYSQAGSSELFDTNEGLQGQVGMPVSRLEVDDCYPERDAFAEVSTSGSSEETESDSSETHSLEPRTEAGMILSDAETRLRAEPRTLDRLEMEGGLESTSGDESDELSLDDQSQYLHDPNPSDVGVSKWQLKGKRNVRNFGKRPMDRFSDRTYLESRGRSLSRRAPSHRSSYYHDNDYTNGVDFIEDDFDPLTQGFGKSRHLPSQAATKRQNLVGQNMIDWEEVAWGRPFRGFWDDRGACFNQTFLGRNGHDMLIDVDLKVQANHQGEHVPWVSLMSRLNGQAIIGHPIQIEALEDGSTDSLVSTSEVYGNLRCDTDRNTVPPVWRTARRTANFRVPRPPPSSSQLDGDEDADDQYFHQSGNVKSKKSLVPSSSRRGNLMKKTHPYIPRSPLQGMKKTPRKANLSSNRKTKALSSIGIDQKFSNKRQDNDVSYYMDGVIKSVDSGPPTVACIPVKLVFSRLLEAVGRAPSGPAKKRGFDEQQ